MEARKITCRGQTRTIREWAAEVGIHVETLRSRLGRGWCIERALDSPLASNATGPSAIVVIGGVAKRRSEWTVESGLSQSAVKWRLKNGWDLARAITTPVDSKSSLWGNEEIKLLRENRGMTNSELAALLPRHSRQSVGQKRRELGITRDDKYATPELLERRRALVAAHLRAGNIGYRKRRVERLMSEMSEEDRQFIKEVLGGDSNP